MGVRLGPTCPYSDSLKAQLQKQALSPVRTIVNGIRVDTRTHTNHYLVLLPTGGSPDLRTLSPAPLRSKAPPTTAISCSGQLRGGVLQSALTTYQPPIDSPPKKPKRPPDELLGKYLAELRNV